ncbi:MAG: bifunctional SulP family inorganic anion transporter/carbonic anhydrase [Verrucomicrobia bacterium]|nr:bifunctional SulP family inorganic anion transporter/carbonic anhydrase [Verrucomicrobiota bacterium]
MSATNYKESFTKDFSAGLVVFLVALPLCLGIALASNAPLISGIIAGVVGGLVVAWTSGSHTSVSGPAAGLTAIVYAQISNLGSYEAFLCAVILAGVFQLIMGWVKAGSLAAFFPSSVIKGLLAAIGIILILKQIPHLFGHDPDWIGDMAFLQQDGKNTFTELVATMFDIHPGAALVGLVSLGLLILWDKTALKKLPLPAPLAVVVLGTALTYLLKPMGQLMEIGTSHLVQVPGTGSARDFLGTLPNPDFSVMFSSGVFIAAITIAIVATLETLLNLEAVDKLDHQQRISPPNRELVAQGTGNILSGLFGGLPITSVIVRSSVNIASGGQTRLACFIHGIFLLTTVVFFPGLLNQIPLATLAAILIVTGFKLAGIPLFKQMWKEGKSQFAPFVLTILAIVLTDLLIGILIGMAVAIFFILQSNLQRPVRRIIEKHVGGDVLRIELANQVSFLNRASLLKSLHEIPHGSQVVIDARNTNYIDPDIMDLIADFEKETAPAHGLILSLVGFQNHYKLSNKVQYVDVSTRDVQAQVNPENVLQMLKEGNDRFVRGEKLSRDLLRQVDVTAQGQYPLAVVLACMDSRVATEMVFDLGIGDLFSVRVAGNIAFNKALGSLEFGCAVAGSKLLLILGHTRCGAVKATIDLVDQGKTALEATGCENLDSVVEVITDSVKSETDTKENRTSSNEAFVDRVAEINVVQTMQTIYQNSPTLRRLIDEEKVMIVGGIYDVKSGKVTFIDKPVLSIV